MTQTHDWMSRWTQAHGADGIVLISEVASLVQSTVRVFGLMADCEWHSAIDINLVAGEDGIPAMEGLRRMRDLRPILHRHGYQIEKRRSEKSRLFSYRISKLQEVERG